MKESDESQDPSASELISKRIAELGTGAGKPSSRMRKLIRKQTRTSSRSGSGWALRSGRTTASSARANPTECREAYLRQGRLSAGSGHLFNSSLEGNARRAIDIHEGEESGRVRLQGAHSPSGRPQQCWQVETCEESEVLRILKAEDDRASREKPNGSAVVRAPGVLRCDVNRALHFYLDRLGSRSVGMKVSARGVLAENGSRILHDSLGRRCPRRSPSGQHFSNPSLFKGRNEALGSRRQRRTPGRAYHRMNHLLFTGLLGHPRPFRIPRTSFFAGFDLPALLRATAWRMSA